VAPQLDHREIDCVSFAIQDLRKGSLDILQKLMVDIGLMFPNIATVTLLVRSCPSQIVSIASVSLITVYADTPAFLFVFLTQQMRQEPLALEELVLLFPKVQTFTIMTCLLKEAFSYLFAMPQDDTSRIFDQLLSLAGKCRSYGCGDLETVSFLGMRVYWDCGDGVWKAAQDMIDI
jgi:hypothetical protein